jgi:hypothetical protein
MAVYREGCYVERLTSGGGHAVINPGTNRFLNDKTMVFPCNGQYGEEVAVYSRKFRYPADGTQKCILVDLGEDKQDIVAFRPQPAAVGDRVVLIPVHGDPENVVAITDMSFFQNGCFETGNGVMWKRGGYYVDTPDFWQTEKKDGGACPWTLGASYRTDEFYYGPNSHYSLGVWASKPTGYEVAHEVMAYQSGPLKNIRYLSFFCFTRVSNAGNWQSGAYLYISNRWRQLFSTYNDIHVPTDYVNGTPEWYYVEIDLVARLVHEGLSASGAKTALASQTGKFAFGVDSIATMYDLGMQWEANFDGILATR